MRFRSRQQGEGTVGSYSGYGPFIDESAGGMSFAERCKYACEKCESEIPAYRQYTRTQRAMCVFTEEELNAMDKEGKADGRTE